MTHRVWTLVTLAALAWLSIGLLVAVGVGRSIRLADERTLDSGVHPVQPTAAWNLSG